MIVDKDGNIVRDDPKTARAAGRRAGAGAELKPGQERKELEGVFVVKDNKAVFMPVKTGIAGEKYFEVLSGVKVGDAVIIGPFSSVRALAEGAASRSRRRRGDRPGDEEVDVPVLRVGGDRARRDLVEQAAIVSHRAGEHRRGHLDHRGGVAGPGDERLRHRRHRVERRRRQFHHPADAGRPHASRRGPRPQQPAHHADRGGGGQEVQRQRRRGRGAGQSRRRR